jgi:hypothetical protein
VNNRVNAGLSNGRKRRGRYRSNADSEEGVFINRNGQPGEIERETGVRGLLHDRDAAKKSIEELKGAGFTVISAKS